MYSRSTSPPIPPAHDERGLGRVMGLVALLVVLVATVAWLTGLYLAARWLLAAVF